MSTPIEQFIQTLTELERTMTKGPWRSEYASSKGYSVWGPCVPTGSMQIALTGYAKFDGANAHGIAHLKNSNPTVIAMLKAVVELRAALLIDSSISQTTTRRLLEFDAHLNTLAELKLE